MVKYDRRIKRIVHKDRLTPAQVQRLHEEALKEQLKLNPDVLLAKKPE